MENKAILWAFNFVDCKASWGIFFKFVTKLLTNEFVVWLIHENKCLIKNNGLCDGLLVFFNLLISGRRSYLSCFNNNLPHIV